MIENDYINVLRKSKTNNVKIALSPRRQIVEKQHKRCYICEKSLSNMTCYFEIVEGPDMKTGVVSKELRALCPSCRFSLGKNPVKKSGKRETEKEIKERKQKEKKQEQEEINLFRELRLQEVKKKKISSNRSEDYDG